ncbi:helix-turn-helix domain-containing protein [Paenibacillus sp. MCAF9]|uniref:helix-turn-helix domain-containing protein n=1 Tax=Paenibacillus sp. MCAF9 TaxID=3233046 RepID=UPI003F994C7E
MEIKYNEKTGTADIEAWLIPTLRGLAKLKCDITIHIKYEPEPESAKAPILAAPIIMDRDDITKSEELLPPVLTVKEIKEFLCCGINQVYKLVNSGELQVTRIGKKIVVSRPLFLKWLEGKNI